MFTGIIETTGIVKSLLPIESNLQITLQSDITTELKIDQSVSHNGVCLTVVNIDGHEYTVTAIDETLQKTNLHTWQVGQKVNLERCMPANGRFDGHIVQGHVDTTAICSAITNQSGSWLFSFDLKEPTLLMVNKGSICINGISLTIVECSETNFSVAIIPYTFEFTNMSELFVGSAVNIEFDIIGKYLAKMAIQR